MMVVRIAASLIVAVLSVSAGNSLCRAEDESFLSSAISSVVDKVGKYTSGEKKLLSPDDDGQARGAEYGTDTLGRKLSEPITIRTVTPAKTGE